MGLDIEETEVESIDLQSATVIIARPTSDLLYQRFDLAGTDGRPFAFVQYRPRFRRSDDGLQLTFGDYH